MTNLAEALRRAVQAGNNLLSELEAHEENTGEPLIEEDRAVVMGAKADLEFARTALRGDREQGEG
jgi:hypothetical protein